MAEKKNTNDFSKGVTERFLKSIDKILADRSKGKMTQERLGKILGINSSNINRLRNDDTRRVTVEACCRLISMFDVSPNWLMTGRDVSANDIEKRIADLEAAVLGTSKKKK